MYLCVIVLHLFVLAQVDLAVGVVLLQERWFESVGAVFCPDDAEKTQTGPKNLAGIS